MSRLIFSIKWLFIIVIVFLVAGIFISNYLFSYYLHRRSVTENINSLSENMKLQTDNFVKAVEIFLYNIQGLVCCGILNFDEIEKTNGFFIHFMQKFPQVTSINYGDGKGNGYLILYDKGKWFNRIKKERQKNIVIWNTLNNEGKIIKREIKFDDYDPRQTTWYKQALNAEGIQWSKEYIFRTTKDPGITASLLLCSKSKEIVGIDIMIKDLSLFLGQLSKKFPSNSKLYLISDGHQIIALVDEISVEAGKIYELNEKEFPLLYKALSIINNGDQLKTLEFKGQKWFLNIKRWNLGSRNLYLLVLIPTISVTGTLNLYLLYQIIVSLFISFFVLLYLTKKYTFPIIELSKEIQNLGIKKISLENYSNRKDEIGHLSKAISEISYQIMEKKELERKLSKAEQFEAIRRSLNEAIHRFKDLINVIQGFALIAQTKISNEFAKGAIDQIINASKRAIYLIKEILTLTGERKYEMHKTDLNSFISIIKSKILYYMDKIETEFIFYEGMLNVSLDKEAFTEAIMNIITNAKEAMPQVGRLTIKTDLVKISGKYFALLLIQDTGVGMDKDTKDKIFDPFFTTKGAKGTGLGLSITYRTILDHGGFIEVDSELNKGTIFRIYLPIHDELT